MEMVASKYTPEVGKVEGQFLSLLAGGGNLIWKRLTAIGYKTGEPSPRQHA